GAGLRRRHPVDLVEAEQRRVLLVAGRRTGGALQVVALAHAEPADLGGGDVHVAPAGQEAARPHEAVALVTDLEQALDLDRLAGRLERAGLALPFPLVLAAAVGGGGVEAPVAAPPPAAPAAALAVALPGLGLGALGPGARLTARAGSLVVALGGDRAGAATVAAGAVRPQRRGLGLDRRGLGGGGGGLGRSAEGEPLRFGRGRLGGGRRGGLGRRPRGGLGGRAPAPVGLRRLGRRGRRLGRLGVGGLLAGGPLLGLLPGRLGDRRPAGRFVEDRLDEVRLAEAGRPPDAHGGRDLVQLVTVAQPELGPFGGELPRSGHRSCVLLADASKIRWDGRLRSSTGSCGPGRGPACPLRDGMPSIARLTTSSMTWASVASRL